MSQSKKNILKEAIIDAKKLKEAAMSNAETVLSQYLKDSIKDTLQEGLENFVDEELDLDGKEEETKMDDELDLDELTDDEEEEEREEEDDDEDSDEDLEEGLTERDLAEALEEALKEVDHGKLGDMEDVEPDRHPTGLEDLDSKEEGWEQKTVRGAEDRTVKEVSGLKRKVAGLVKENVLLKKANVKLRSTVNEVQLFNAKLLYATKLIKTEGLAPKVRNKMIRKLDEAKSHKEAKSLYESFQMALSLIGEKSSRKSSLTEALGSNTGKNISGDEKEDKMLKEYAHRNQVLSGIVEDEDY